MRSVEVPGHDVVEGVVVEPRQPVGAVRIGPDPGLECALDLGELLLGRLRLDRVEDAPLAVALLHRVEDLRDRRVQRVRQELAGMAAMGAPFRRAGGRPRQLPRIHRPAGEFGRVVDGDVGIHRLLDEGDDVGRGNPGRAEAGGDVGGTQIRRLHRARAPRRCGRTAGRARQPRVRRRAWSARRPRGRRPLSATSRFPDRGRSPSPSSAITASTSPCRSSAT